MYRFVLRCEMNRSWKDQSAATTTPRTFWKHSRHSTGLCCTGRNGTVVCVPHSAQRVWVSRLLPGVLAARFALHFLQCFGSLTNFFSRKNNCSPAEKTKGSAHSTQIRILSSSLIQNRLIGRSLARIVMRHSLHLSRAKRWTVIHFQDTANMFALRVWGGKAVCAHD